MDKQADVGFHLDKPSQQVRIVIRFESSAFEKQMWKHDFIATENCVMKKHWWSKMSWNKM
jgi:hypothetical protein